MEAPKLIYRKHARLEPSGRSDWNTPKALVDRVTAFHPGGIGLDPATTLENPCGARVICVAPDEEWAGVSVAMAPRPGARVLLDGLKACWRGHGLVYCNPPYGRGVTGPWVRKAVAEFVPSLVPAFEWRTEWRDDELLLLLPASTEVRWWHAVAPLADVVLFFAGRLSFDERPGAPFPSALLYLGPRSGSFRRHFADLGWMP